MRPGLHFECAPEPVECRMESAAKVKRLLTMVLVAVAAGILLVVVTLRVIENQLIYFPPRYPEGFPPPQTLRTAKLKTSGC